MAWGQAVDIEASRSTNRASIQGQEEGEALREEDEQHDQRMRGIKEEHAGRE
jgi:hypothetical protein